MNKKLILVLAIVSIAAAGFLILSQPKLTDQPIRVGWQPPWVNQGQIAVILQKTDILEKSGLQAKFTGFSFGPPMTEAGLSGQLDVMFLGDQPAFNINAKDSSWKIVAPLIHYKSAILVPSDSAIQSVSELKGKTILTGIGSTTYRDTIQALAQAGIEPNEVIIKNLSVDEHLAFLQSAKEKGWGDVDAVATYDPTITIALSRGLCKKIAEFNSLGVIAMNEKFIKQNPEKAIRFIKAVEEAFSYYAANEAEVNRLYAEASRYNASNELFAQMAKQEPKLHEKNPALNLDNKTLLELQEHYQTAIDLKLINNPRKFDDVIFDLNGAA